MDYAHAEAGSGLDALDRHVGFSSRWFLIVREHSAAAGRFGSHL
jgi:hypothetical protein